jgi:hypothetical protein
VSLFFLLHSKVACTCLCTVLFVWPHYSTLCRILQCILNIWHCVSLSAHLIQLFAFVQFFVLIYMLFIACSVYFFIFINSNGTLRMIRFPFMDGLQYFHSSLYIYDKGSKFGLYQLLFVYWFWYHVNSFHQHKFYLSLVYIYKYSFVYACLPLFFNLTQKDSCVLCIVNTIS